MKKNNILFACIIASITLFGCAKQEIRNIDSKGKNIICFGDSITFGYGVNPGEDYPSVLSKISGKQIINAGVDADTTVEALKRLNSDVLDKEPFLVIIEFSGNDFLKKIPIEITEKNIKKMIDKIQARDSMVALVDTSAGFFLPEYRRILRKIAKEKGAIFVPEVLSSIITNPNMKSDFLHPNAEGYKLIAERINHAINPYLKAKQF